MMTRKYFMFDKSLNIQQVPKFTTKEQKQKININIANYLNLGYYIIIPLLSGVVIGRVLDNLLKKRNLFFIIFFSLGIIGTFYNLIKLYLDERDKNR